MTKNITRAQLCLSDLMCFPAKILSVAFSLTLRTTPYVPLPATREVVSFRTLSKLQFSSQRNAAREHDDGTVGDTESVSVM